MTGQVGPSAGFPLSRYDLSGRVAMVTGGGSGIGEECARLLARCGAHVAVTDIRPAEGERVAASVRAAGGTAFAAGLDVQDERAVDETVDAIVAREGGLHIAVNNAGISAPGRPLADCDTQTWRRVLSVNLDGVFYCLRAQLRVMRLAGGGAIVNVSSILGQVGRAGSGPYVSSKHAVVGLTRAAALDHAADGVRVNAVGPGHTRTPLFDSIMDEDARSELESQYPIRRLGTPREIAEMVGWLASDAASFVTGAFYPVDGGYLSR